MCLDSTINTNARNYTQCTVWAVIQHTMNMQYSLFLQCNMHTNICYTYCHCCNYPIQFKEALLAWNKTVLPKHIVLCQGFTTFAMKRDILPPNKKLSGVAKHIWWQRLQSCIHSSLYTVILIIQKRYLIAPRNIQKNNKDTCWNCVAMFTIVLLFYYKRTVYM